MTLTDYLLNAALISLVVLQIRGHRVTAVRLLVPVVLTIWGASQFLQSVPTAGSDLALEVALVFEGCCLGVLAALATGIHRDGEGAIAKAGAAAALLWVVGIGARVGFYLWVTHGGQAAVSSFSASVHVTSGAAWAAGFILMAMAEVVSRTGVLYLKTVHSGAVIPRGGLLGRSALA
jgi:hypothetical protein